MSTEANARNSVLELAGLVLSLFGGAVVGLLIPLKAEGGVATAIVFAIIGAIVWTRRRQPAGVTIGACLLALLVGWPVAFLLLDWLHQYY